MYTLGIDIGGTGCKCVAFSQLGEQLALCYEEYAVPAGTDNLPPEALWASVENVLWDCVKKLPDPEKIGVVTVSSFGESFVAVDAEGKPLDEIRMYFGNSKSAAFDALVKKVGPEIFMETCRILPDASYSLAKMLYTLEIAPQKVDCFLFIAGFVCYRLSGVRATDVSLACRSLLYDVKEGNWSQTLLEAANISEKQLAKVERDIAGLEAQIAGLDRQSEEFASDYQKLLEIGQARQALEEQLESLYERWEALQS